MIIVFFILIFVMLVIVGTIFSTLNIRIQKLYFSNQNLEKMKWDYLVFLELSLFGMIKIIKLRIDPKKMARIAQKFKVKEKMRQMNFKQKIKNKPRRISLCTRTGNKRCINNLCHDCIFIKYIRNCHC